VEIKRNLQNGEKERKENTMDIFLERERKREREALS